MIIYDIEIKKAIESKDYPAQPGIEYCEGWKDHANMGISTIGVYDYWQDRYRIFCDDNISQFYKLVDRHDVIAGFNNIGFDNKVILANYQERSCLSFPKLEVLLSRKSYDILQEIWKADGLPPEFHYPSHIGYGLDATMAANFPGFQKSGHGALAPVDYQKGNWGSLIDYCLNDVYLEKMVIDRILQTGRLINPRDDSLNVLNIRNPFEGK